jgi:hypothetical protein
MYTASSAKRLNALAFGRRIGSMKDAFAVPVFIFARRRGVGTRTARVSFSQ